MGEVGANPAMNGKIGKKDSIEIESGQLQAELVQIKERLGALETIASISNRKEVEAYVRAHLPGGRGLEIMRECAEPRTREYLMSKLHFASAQALDHHLNPLRRDDLIQQRFDESRVQTFEWSNLFRRLPASARAQILEPPQASCKPEERRKKRKLRGSLSEEA